MDMQNIMNVMCKPIWMIGDYMTACKKEEVAVLPKLQLEEKAVEVKMEPKEDNHQLVYGKIWQTAEQIGDVFLEVATHPLTKKMMKNVVNQAVEKAEVGAMEKAVNLVGDKILPGDVAAIKIAFMLINGLSAIAKQ